MKWLTHLLLGISLCSSFGCQPDAAPGGCMDNSDCAPGWTCERSTSACMAQTMPADLPLIQPPLPRMNRAPIIQTLTASATEVYPSYPVILTVTATDPDGDNLTYAWQAPSGYLTGSGSGSGNTVTWAAPNMLWDATIRVTVKDGRGGVTEGQKFLQVIQPRILIDASKDGTLWWYPQTGPFVPNLPHSGKALADHLRTSGYLVEELARGAIITEALLQRHDRVIRAAGSAAYGESELQAYEAFTKRATSLVLFSQRLLPGQQDALAERLGIHLSGSAQGTVSKFAEHPIAQGVWGFSYSYGSALLDPTQNPNITVLGWLANTDYVDLNGNSMKDADEPTGAAVMGVLANPTSRIFFAGDLRGIQSVPQPFVNNLVRWAF